MERYSTDKLRTLLPDSVGKNKIFIDLGCGTRKRPGYIGVDTVKLDGVDIVCNLKEGLPFEDNAVDGLYSSFSFGHAANTILLFKETCRICRPRAVMELRVSNYK
jgi:predicted SAM-dependent methyltransferase